jgi:hypothetical protein
VIIIPVDDHARHLTERQHGIIAERDTAIGSGAKLILQMNRVPDNGGRDSVARDALRLILDLVDDAHGRGIIGRLGHDWKANDEKKGKLAQRTWRSMHDASPLEEPIHRRLSDVIGQS